MKFRGNKKKSHVLIYCILFISILVLVGPLYAISYNTLKDQVLKDSQAAVNRGMSRLDMEIEVLQNIRLENMESIFNEHIIMEGMDWNQFRNSLFEKKSEFDARYVEDLYIDGEKQPSLVVSLSLSPSINQPEAVLVWIYSIADLFEDMNLSNYQEIFEYVAFNDEIIFADGNEQNRESHQIVDGCKNINLKVTMDVSEQYFDKNMRTFRNFLIIYLATMIIFIICLELALSYWKNKPIKQMVKLMANLTGDNSISDKDIEYISDTKKSVLY